MDVREDGAAAVVTLESGDVSMAAVAFESSDVGMAAVTFESGGGSELSADAGVHFGGLGSTGIGDGGLRRAGGCFFEPDGNTTGLDALVVEGLGSSELGGGGDLHPLDFSGASHTVAGVTGVGCPPKLAPQPLGAEEHVGADPAPAFAPPAAAGADLCWQEGDRLDVGGVHDMQANFQLAVGDGDLVGGMMRRPQAAVLHMTLGAEHVGADPAPAFAPPGDRLGVGGVRDMPANFQLAAGHRGLGGMMMRRPQAAVLAMTLGAMTIIAEPDAPWPNQLGALLAWLGGCIALFLSWS